MKHSKQKGNLGFSSTLKEIHKLGLNVFSEIGDNSKIDMIVEHNDKLIRIQIKYVTEADGYIVIPSRKSGPNGYRYHYKNTDVDLFSVYLPTLDKVIFVPAKTVCDQKSSLNIRFKAPKNGQTSSVHMISDFEDLKNILDRITNI